MMQGKRKSRAPPPRRKRGKQSWAINPKHAELVELVRALLSAAKTLRDERRRSLFATGADGSTKVGEVYAVFSTRLEEGLALWSTGTEKKNDPTLPRRVTEQLLSIFSNTAVTDSLIVPGYEHIYGLVHAYWRTSYPNDLAKVVSALRMRSEELRQRDQDLAAARASERVIAAGAALHTRGLAPDLGRREFVAGANNESEIKKSEIRVYQSEPPVGRDQDRDLAISDLATHRGAR